VTNGFNDCKVYILVINLENPDDANKGQGNTSVFTIDTDALLDPVRSVSAFSSSRIMSTIVIAEKGTNSTSDLMPSQQQYRSALEWESYRRNLRHMKSSTRPHLVRTKGYIDLFDIRGGHLFMAEDFTARDPSTEIRKLERASTRTAATLNDPLAEDIAPALAGQTEESEAVNYASVLRLNRKRSRFFSWLHFLRKTGGYLSGKRSRGMKG